MAFTMLCTRSMRITDEMTYRMLVTNIQKNQRSIYDAQEKISSGRKISQPSDDPGGYERVRLLHEDDANIKQYAENTANVSEDLVQTENTLQNILNIFHRASELTIAAGDGTIDPTDRASMGEEINQMLNSLVGLANSTQGGYFLFGGLRTDTQPYTTTTDASGMITAVNYQGNQGVRNVEINKGIYMEANIPGSNPGGENAIFTTSTTDLFDNLIQLRDDLTAGTSPIGTNHLNDINNSRDHIINMLSIVGARQESVQMNSRILDLRETNLASALDNAESIDIAEAMMELSQHQVAYEAALRASSGILNQRSLIDYL